MRASERKTYPSSIFSPKKWGRRIWLRIRRPLSFHTPAFQEGHIVTSQRLQSEELLGVGRADGKLEVAADIKRVRSQNRPTGRGQQDIG